MSTERAVILSCNTPDCIAQLTWLPGSGLTARSAAQALGWETAPDPYGYGDDDAKDTCPTCLMNRDAEARTA